MQRLDVLMQKALNFTGGQELNVFDSCLITEEIAFGCAGVKAAILTSNIGVS